MIRLPGTTGWKQLNTSDRAGNLWATKNVNLDEFGYLKLSPRAVKIIDEAANADVGVPVAFGQFSQGEFQVATTSDAAFNLDIDNATLNATENSGTSEPTLTIDSHARFWIDRWHASTATAVLSKDANGSASATWTSRITGLTSGVRHLIEVFASRNQLCVANGNVVKQYDTSYANTIDLTIPSDFEITGLAYNNGKMGVITRSAQGSTGQVVEAKFYYWDGSTTSATGYGVGSDACMSIGAYRGTFVIITRSGELKIFNGGGFETLAVFPFYSGDQLWNNIGATYPIGDAIIADGDVLYMNVGLELNEFGRKREVSAPNCPSGVWCYDPQSGLYHRWSPSASQIYLTTVSAGGTNTTTDIMTAATGTIPATGNIARYIRSSGTGITGLTLQQDYYIIKQSASTFSLATTKENAIAGIKIDLTAADSDTSYFHMFDLIDYGVTQHLDTGAVALFGDSNYLYRDIIFGGDYETTALANNDSICMIVPFLENRGWFITPKIFPDVTEATVNKMTVKYRPLKTNDTIVVKMRDREVAGLPVTAPNSATTDELTWSSDDECYTTTDLSEAKTYLDAGGSLELELTAGAGAGQTVQISSISSNSGTYALELDESVIGITAGVKSYFIIDNWKILRTVNSTDSDNTKGYSVIPITSSEKFIQFKIELRGSDTTIEDILLTNVAHRT